jgi:hypothetical protein
VVIPLVSVEILQALSRLSRLCRGVKRKQLAALDYYTFGVSFRLKKAFEGIKSLCDYAQRRIRQKLSNQLFENSKKLFFFTIFIITNVK